MLTAFGALDKWGIVKDVEDHLLAPEAWSDGRNVRFRDGSIEKVGGSLEIFAPPSVAPYWLLHTYAADSAPVWVYAGLNKVYAVIDGVHTNITRQAVGVDVNYAATADKLWNGGVLGGIPILNNGVDVPQRWAPIAAATKLVDLENWPSTWRCDVIRPFKNFLLALNLTESSTRFIHRIRWSDPADPGAVPARWTAGSPAHTAGLVELTDVDNGGILDGLMLRDLFIIYKERAVHGMQFIGGTFKFRTFSIFEGTGILAKNCVCVFDEGRSHFVATGEDIVVHNTQQRTSLLDKRLRKWLAKNIDPTNYERSFCVANPKDGEVWFCFPLEGSTWANLALVWDRLSNAISFRDLDQASFIAQGVVPAVSGAWDADAQAWDADTSGWQELVHAAFIQQLVQAKPTGPNFLHLDQGTQFQGANFTAYIERTGNTTVGMQGGQLNVDPTMRKLAKHVFIQAKGGPIGVRIATQQREDGPLTWSGEKIFVPGTDRKVDFVQSGLLWGIRFEQVSSQSFKLSGYQVDIEPLGRY